jgi:hypothetical protein
MVCGGRNGVGAGMGELVTGADMLGWVWVEQVIWDMGIRV